MTNKALVITAICFAALMPAWASSQDDATLSLKIQSAQDDDSDILNFAKQGTAPKEETRPKHGTPGSPIKGNASIDVKQETKPLDPLLWAGNYFDEKVATALLKDESTFENIWKKIPAWQAGDWEMRQGTCTKAVKYINGQQYADTACGVYTSKSKDSMGLQRDREGNIWYWCDSGYWTETDYDNCVGHSFVKISAPGRDDYPDFYVESVDFDVDKATHKIINVQQRRTWERFSYLAPGLMKEEEVHTVYNENGEPTYSAWNTVLKKRIETFKQSHSELVSNKEYSKLIRELFTLYLENNGLANLIPVEDDYSDLIAAYKKAQATKPILKHQHGQDNCNRRISNSHQSHLSD